MLRNLKNFLRILPEDNVHPEVARHFKHNVYVNTMDMTLFIFGDSFISVNTILPVFAATLTDSPLVIGLIPAIINAGWFLPQLFMAGLIEQLPKKLPFTLKMAVLERIPYLFFPILALLIPSIGKDNALTLFIALLFLRGFAPGFVALPWQEVIASAIPISHRSRYFGVSRVLGQIMGVLGSALAALIFNRLPYPYSYALAFSITVIVQWLSFYFFSKNREPDIRLSEMHPADKALTKKKLVDFKAYGKILSIDKNFRFYLASRSMNFVGFMATGFLAVYAIQQFNLADDQAAIFTGLFFLSGILGNALWGMIGDRVGPKRILLIATAAWLASLIFAIIAPNVWIFYLVFLLYGLSNSGSIMGDAILVMELGDDTQRPSYLGLARSITGIFLLFSPMLAGWMVKASGYLPMFWLSLVCSVLSFVLFLKVKDRPRLSR